MPKNVVLTDSFEIKKTQGADLRAGIWAVDIHLLFLFLRVIHEIETGVAIIG